MSREEFLQYIEYPQKLQALDYDELNKLVEQYPYCQNLRFLQAKKYQLDNHAEYEQKLRAVAIYMSSRTHLYQSINHAPIRVEKIDDSALDELFVETDKTEVVDLPSEAVEAPDESSPIQVDSPPSAAEPNTDDRQIEHRSAELRIAESKDILAEKDLKPIEENPSIYLDELLYSEINVGEEKARISIVEAMDDSATVAPFNEAEEDEEEEEDEIIEIPDININEVLDATRQEDGQRKESSSVLPPSEQPLNRTYNTAPFEDEELSFDELKASIPFEVTNEEDLEDEDIAYISAPEPKSVFNSWFEQIKNGKKKVKKKGKKKQKKKQEEKLKGKSKKAKKAAKAISDQKQQKEKEKKKHPSKLSELPVQKIEKKKPEKKNKKEVEKEKPKKKNKNAIRSFAQKSIVENETIASETLAKLLVEQGSPKKAIKMYERLSLIFPEKKAFFAERIEKLKKN